jgi:hypothetical protein
VLKEKAAKTWNFIIKHFNVKMKPFVSSSSLVERRRVSPGVRRPVSGQVLEDQLPK